MQLKVINSNSSGNGYLLQSATDTLLIECGVHISRIKKTLDYNLRNVHAIVTHSHGDHACSVKDVLNAGIKVYASSHTFEATNTSTHHRANAITAGRLFKAGTFSIKPFEVEHDVPCFGFMIDHEECGLTLFLTDTMYCKYSFPGLRNIIIEANHCQEIIDSNNTPRFLEERIIQSHMNIETCKELLLANDLTAVNNIVLIHLSDANSDARRFQKEVHKLTGKTVYVAEPGLTIPNFNKQPF